MSPSKKHKKTISADQKKLATLIHQWAYTDSKKHPKKFDALFKKIWDLRQLNER